MKDYSKQTTVDGVRAIELQYRPIRHISSGTVSFFQSRTQLNTPGMGTLMAENFRKISDVSSQGIELFQLELLQAMQTHKKLISREISFEWLSVYMPKLFLKQNSCHRTLRELCEKNEVENNRLCFMLPHSLLSEIESDVAESIQILRDYGFHFMITSYGGNGCPLMNLSEYPVDFVMLSPEVTHFLGEDERKNSCVSAILNLVHSLDAIPIADGVTKSQQASLLYEMSCEYCAGALSGDYVLERYIKNKK